MPAWTSRVAPLATLIVPPWIVPPVIETALAMEAVVRSRVPPETATAPPPSAVSAVAARVPAETVTPPRKVLAPERVTVPAEVLAREPGPVRIVETVPALSVTWATGIDPPERTPAARVTLLTRPVVVPRASSPPLMVTAPAPSAASLATARMPPVTVVPPVKVLAVSRVWTPAPDLLRAMPPVMEPLKVAAAEPPRVTEPAVPVRMPVPAREAAVTDWPLTSTVPASAMVRRLAASPRAAALPRVTVPPLTATSPVKVFAPERVTAPVPDLTKPAPPVSAAETVPEVAVSWATSKEPPVRAPPLSVTKLTMLLPPRFSEPPVTVTALVPSAALSPRVTVPPEMAVEPAKATLAPLRVRVPEPVLTREPSPSTREARVPPVAVRTLVVARLMVPPVIVPPLRKTVLPTFEVPRLTRPPLTERSPEPRAASLPTLRVPSETVTPPPKVFAASRVRVVLFDLVRPAEPVSWEVTVPATRVTWLRAILPPVKEPEVRVTRLAMPAPEVPERSSVPPSMVTEAPERAVLEPAARVPPVMLTAPVKTLSPVRVCVAAPVLAMPRLPESRPAKVVSVPPARVTVAGVRTSLFVSSPPVPARPERVTDWPLRSTTPVAERVRVLLEAPSAEVEPRVTLPPETSAPPVKVLAPERVTSPAMAFTKALEPVRVAAIVPDLAATWLRAMEPPVSVPPSTVTPLTMVLPLRLREPAETMTAPEPNAALAPRVTLPPAIVVEPVKPVLSPVMIRVPVSVLESVPAPVSSEARVPAWAVRVLAVARLMVPPVMVPPLR